MMRPFEDRAVSFPIVDTFSAFLVQKLTLPARSRPCGTLTRAVLRGAEDTRYATSFVDCFYTRSCRRKPAKSAAR